MNYLLKLISTAAAGALDVWVGIITGLALGLSPALSGAGYADGAVAGVTLVVAAGGRLQHLIYRSRRLAKRRERIERAWERYGTGGRRCIPKTGDLILGAKFREHHTGEVRGSLLPHVRVNKQKEKGRGPVSGPGPSLRPRTKGRVIAPLPYDAPQATAYVNWRIFSAHPRSGPFSG